MAEKKSTIKMGESVTLFYLKFYWKMHTHAHPTIHTHRESKGGFVNFNYLSYISRSVPNFILQETDKHETKKKERIPEGFSVL